MRTGSGPIGLVTYAKYPDLTDDDRPLIGELASLGLEGVPVLWDDRTADWAQFRALVLRSAWDYHLRPTEFVAWLAHLEQQEFNSGTPLRQFAGACTSAISESSSRAECSCLERNGLPARIQGHSRPS